MITNKLFKQWRVDGNMSWKGDVVDTTESGLRSPWEETLEEELLWLDPEKWEVGPKAEAGDRIQGPRLLPRLLPDVVQPS